MLRRREGLALLGYVLMLLSSLGLLVSPPPVAGDDVIPMAWFFFGVGLLYGAGTTRPPRSWAAWAVTEACGAIGLYGVYGLEAHGPGLVVRLAVVSLLAPVCIVLFRRVVETHDHVDGPSATYLHGATFPVAMALVCRG